MTRRSLISQQPWVYPLAMSACEAAPLGAKGMTMAITDASLPVNWLSRRGLLRTGLAAFLAFAALGPNSAVADRTMRISTGWAPGAPLRCRAPRGCLQRPEPPAGGAHEPGRLAGTGQADEQFRHPAAGHRRRASGDPGHGREYRSELRPRAHIRGNRSITIAPGAYVISDPVHLAVPPSATWRSASTCPG